MHFRVMLLMALGLSLSILANAQSITNLTLNPTSIVGGNNSTGTVTISSLALSRRGGTGCEDLER